jgi:hypothetical protein
MAQNRGRRGFRLKHDARVIGTRLADEFTELRGLSFAITPSAPNRLTSQRMKANNRYTCQAFFCL